MSKEIPIYEPLKLELKAQIDNGDLSEGQQLPSESELVDKFSLSRHQVRQALRELELDGYLTRAQGRGSFVAPRSTRSQGVRVTGTRTAAFSYPQYASLYARQIVDGFLQHMANNGFKTLAYNMLLDDHSEREFLGTVRDSGVAGLGIWLIHGDEPARDLVFRLHEARFPLVLVDRFLPDIDTDCVASDNVDIGYRLTQALIEAGHRRIAFVASRNQRDFTSVRERHEGYRRAVEEAHLSAEASLLEFGETRQEQEAYINEAVARYQRPTAFCCINTHVFRAMHRRLVHLGFPVGEEIQLATVDDDGDLEHYGVPVTCIAQDGHTIGARSAEFLIARIEDPERPTQREFVRAGFVRQIDPAGPTPDDTFSQNRSSQFPTVK